MNGHLRRAVAEWVSGVMATGGCPCGMSCSIVVADRGQPTTETGRPAWATVGGRG